MARTRATHEPLQRPDVVLAPPAPGSDQAARSMEDQPVISNRPRRKMGRDRVIIAEDFNAPPSPEEAELFGL